MTYVMSYCQLTNENSPKKRNDQWHCLAVLITRVLSLGSR
jgi:hypothetical protein